MNIYRTYSSHLSLEYDNYKNRPALMAFKLIKLPKLSRSKFKEHYLKEHGFSAWLKSISGAMLHTEQIFDLACTYIEISKRKADEIPALLGLLSRTYQLTYSTDHHIFSKLYWEQEIGAPQEGLCKQHQKE